MIDESVTQAVSLDPEALARWTPTIDSVSGPGGGVVYESFDREPDGSPTAYLSRPFGSADTFEVVGDAKEKADG